MITVVSILTTYREGLVRGLLVTCALSLVVWVLGLSLGIVYGAWVHMRPSWKKSLDMSAFLLSSIPFIVLLFWLHYPLQEFLRVVVPPFITAAAALSLVNTLFVANIVRHELNEFPDEFVLAGVVCGLSRLEILSRITFPIIARKAIPQLLFLQVQMLQMTVFASLISVQELFRVAQQINALIYKPVEIYTALALFFIAICAPLNLLAHWLKERYTRPLSQ